MDKADSVWLNLESAAKYSDSSTFTIRRWIKQGILRATKLPSGTWRVRRDELEAFLQGTSESNSRSQRSMVQE